MYDDRPELQNLKKFYSLLTFSNGSTNCIRLEYWAHNGDYIHTRNQYKEIYYNYILRTNVSVPEAPIHGQISFNPDCSSPSDIIPIKDNRTDRTYTYAVCLHKSIYNMTQPEMLVHWVELNLALGVEFMTIYLQNGYVPESYYTIMIPYIKRGIVEVLDWGLRPPVIPGYTKFWGQTAVITECVYRNMYRVKYLGLYDLDEFIVPGNLKTVPELIKKFERETPGALTAASYGAANVFYYKAKDHIPQLNHSLLATECPGMSLPRYYTFNIRNKHKSPFVNKIIVKPGAVISVWTHFALKWLPGYTKEKYFNFDDAHLRHYRVPEKPGFSRSPLTVTSFTLDRYYNETVRGIISNACSVQHHRVKPAV